MEYFRYMVISFLECEKKIREHGISANVDGSDFGF